MTRKIKQLLARFSGSASGFFRGWEELSEAQGAEKFFISCVVLAYLGGTPRNYSR